MKIGEIAMAAGVSKDTVRHYVELSLLSPDKNPDNGYQMFSQKSLNRLRFIKAARELGLHLADIQLIFADAEETHSPCPRVRDLLLERLRETQERIAELTRLHDRMSRAVQQWEAMPNSEPNGHSVCKLIESQISDSQLCGAAAPVREQVHE